MELIRDNDKKRLILMKDNQILFSMSFFNDEFIWLFFTLEPLIITKEIDRNLFEGLKIIMESDYIFDPKNPSQKTETKLTWISDQYCDLEDESSIKRINRLVISKGDEAFQISVTNPYFEEQNIKRKTLMIAFSPGGNGQYSKNLMNDQTLQDDIVSEIFWRCFEQEKVYQKKNYNNIG